MKRSANTITRTINLAHLKSCEKPFEVKKLVSADVMESCPNQETSYKTSRPITINVCSRKELERTCPPKLCDCPPKGPPPSRRTIMASWINLAIKGAIAGGLVYWTSAEGIWGDSSQTEDLYYRMAETVAPVLSEFPELDEVRLPHLDSMKHIIYEAYNHFICNAISGLITLPVAVKKKIANTIFYCDLNDESSEAKEASAENPVESDTA